MSDTDIMSNYKEVNNTVSQAILDLLNETGKSYYAHFLMNFKRVYTSKIDTLAVAITKEGVKLLINMDYFNSLTPQLRISVLEHEVLHILFKHPLRMGDRKAIIMTPTGQTATLWNVACDMTINQFLKTVHEGWVSLPKGFPPQTTAEIYYDLMLQQAKENSKNGKGEGEANGVLVDDHSQWDSEGLSDEEKEIIEGQIKQAAQDALERNAGRYPAGITNEIKDLLKAPALNWKSILRRFALFASKQAYRESWSRPNRRFSDCMGKVSDPKLKIAICVDSSGSISDDELSEFASEINKLSHYSKDIRVFVCDAEVTETYDYKGKITSFKGRGGTAFNPALQAAKEYKADCIIYLTDGYPCDQPENPNKPLLWVITPNGINDRSFASFGGFVKIPNENNR